MRAVNEETYNENNKLVRLSDVMNIIENQCSDGHMWGTENLTMIDASETIDELSDIPAVDAVTVVRCKDCKHRKNGGLHRSEKDGWTVVYDVPCNLGDDGFCSRGEKVTECSE